MRATLLRCVRRNWWTLVLRGVFAIAFGFFAWFWPGVTLLALILTWAVFACFTGLMTLAGAFSQRR